MVVNVNDESFCFAIHEATTTTSLYHDYDNNNKSFVDDAHRDDEFSFFDHNRHEMRWSMNGARDGFESLSHADELFENGKIRPLCPFLAVAETPWDHEHEALPRGFMSVSMFEEPPLVEPILVYHNDNLASLLSDESMIFNYSHYYSDKINHFHHLNCPRSSPSSSASTNSHHNYSAITSASAPPPVVNIRHSVAPKPSTEAVIHQPSLTLLTLVEEAPCPTHKGEISTHLPSSSPLKVKDLLVQETVLPSLASSSSKSIYYKNGLQKKNKKSTNKVTPFYFTSPPHGQHNNYVRRVDTQRSSSLLYDINSHHSPPRRGAPRPTHSFRHQILACLVCWHEEMTA